MEEPEDRSTPDLRVALARCESYDGRALARALREAEEALGLWDGPLPDTDRVLLKPNLLAAKTPEKAVTTHPALVFAVAKRLKTLGFEVLVGDSPGGALRGLERYWNKTGLKEAAERAGARLVSFESAGSEKISRNGREYSIARPILEHPFIVNLPKLKTHVYTGLTGAVKNLFGAVPGLSKAAMHQQAPRPGDFAARLLDIYEIAAPTLHIADGISVLDTKGPSSGRVRPMNCLMASRDGPALDSLFAHLAGCPVKNFLTASEAKRRGYAGAEFARVPVLGRDPASLVPKDFKVPGIALYRFIPGFMGRLAERLVRAWPEANGACTGCGFCADSCPVQCIEIENKKAVMDARRCILCLCCHELCPEEAVEIERSFLARRIFH